MSIAERKPDFVQAELFSLETSEPGFLPKDVSGSVNNDRQPVPQKDSELKVPKFNSKTHVVIDCNTGIYTASIGEYSQRLGNGESYLGLKDDETIIIEIDKRFVIGKGSYRSFVVVIQDGQRAGETCWIHQDIQWVRGRNGGRYPKFTTRG